MASGGRPPRTYVPGGNDADAGLFLSRFCLGLAVVLKTPVSWRQTCGKKVFYDSLVIHFSLEFFPVFCSLFY